ncbi:hypothetical protein [Amycolatopsis sp. CA-126428]|uniref:hypothetical protein n=1 Tax=Amycolatopsis sp. CA-126428 TaxID=2073158 RepID=UPI000CD1F08F|nr:hypothetical protein [Amycolatopsis sp. CA-126428]
MEPVATALAKALLGPAVKSAGQRLGERAFGPRHEAALRNVYERTLDSVIDSGLPERTPREEREHVRWVVGQAVEVAVEADIFDGAAGAAPLDALLQRLRDPSLGIEIETLDALGVNAVELLARFLDEFPGCLQEEAQRPDSPLFHFAVLRQFDAVRAQVERIAETVGLLPPQVGEQDRIRVLGREGRVRTLTALYPRPSDQRRNVGTTELAMSAILHGVWSRNLDCAEQDQDQYLLLPTAPSPVHRPARLRRR